MDEGEAAAADDVASTGAVVASEAVGESVGAVAFLPGALGESLSLSPSFPGAAVSAGAAVSEPVAAASPAANE